VLLKQAQRGGIINCKVYSIDVAFGPCVSGIPVSMHFPSAMQFLGCCLQLLPAIAADQMLSQAVLTCLSWRCGRPVFLPA